MKRSLTIILLSLVIGVTAMAQGARQKAGTRTRRVKAPQSMPTVDQILDKYVQAIGGEAALGKLTTRVAKGTIEDLISGVTGSIEVYAQAPNKLALIGRAQTKTGFAFDISHGFDGASGWSLNVAGAGIRELSGKDLDAVKREAEFYSETKLKELYPRMTLKGKMRVGAREAYVIEATPAEGDPEKWYFDARSWLLVRIDRVLERPEGVRIPVAAYLEDYREVDGIKLPFTRRRFLPGSKVIIKYNEVKHKVPIEEAKFNRPSAMVAATPDPFDLSSALTAIEKAVEEKRRSLKVPGAALVIVKDDHVILLKGFGVRDVEKGLPVTPDTMFGIGSCTKTFAAMSAVISADEGKLALDDSPKKFISYFKLRDPQADAQVTLRDLLSHRTGLEEFGGDDAVDWSESSREKVVRIGMRAKPTAKFREKGQYSNIMYTAVGEAIAKAQNSTWEEIVASRIFKPLGMNASNFSSRAMREAADFSCGYDSQGKHREVLVCRDYGGADGAINSNAKDMGQWLRLLLGGGSIDGKRIVSEAGFQEMLTKHSEVWGEPYGLGLWAYNREKSLGIQLYGHPGGVDGFNALFIFAPARKLGFAILTNAYGSTLCDATATIILSHLLLQP